MKNKLFDQQLLLKLLVNSWAFLTLIIFWLDFLKSGLFDSLTSVIGIIYVGILGIYAGNKEFDRWQVHHQSKFRGEIFVLIWTLSIIAMTIIAITTNEIVQLPKDTAAIYTAVLAIFAISQKSKTLFGQKKARKRRP
jgi:hypothetical protein